MMSSSPLRAISTTYPHNGRTLIDDVVDPFFSLLTNGKVTGDKVDGPHSDLLDEFPYLGPPHDLHEVREIGELSTLDHV